PEHSARSGHRSSQDSRRPPLPALPAAGPCESSRGCTPGTPSSGLTAQPQGGEPPAQGVRSPGPCANSSDG
ncbi:hypothetical protein P7K49_020060, partial [Saguinus oedipus]